MKNFYYFLFVSFVALVSCSKKNDETAPSNSLHKIAIDNINNVFLNSTWQHVLGGKAYIEFNSKSSTTSSISSIKDSLDLANASSYTITVADGTYDISLYTEPTSSIADTFIRFEAINENYAVKDDSELSFQAMTSDGLITINKDFVKAGTVPTFTPSGANAASYSFGYINNFYYLYVKGGTEGAVSLTEKTTGQTFTKTFKVSVANQYNLAVLTNTVNAVKIVFSDFAYNDVSMNLGCPFINNPMLNKNWKNVYTETYDYDNSGSLISSSLLYPIGYFQINTDSTYNVYSDNVPLDGKWEINESGCNLVLDKGTNLERYFEIVKLSSDSLVIRRETGVRTYIQHYSK
ncbi:hypothetical protein [Rubrolithibacter danxiaensis]|uniref:hypothetical protein n=1 Tax=Rubrolithibacter danxiaensis TaxID=3390805 RepID=UPI003BF8EC74